MAESVLRRKQSRSNFCFDFYYNRENSPVKTLSGTLLRIYSYIDQRKLIYDSDDWYNTINSIIDNMIKENEQLPHHSIHMYTPRTIFRYDFSWSTTTFELDLTSEARESSKLAESGYATRLHSKAPACVNAESRALILCCVFPSKSSLPVPGRSIPCSRSSDWAAVVMVSVAVAKIATGLGPSPIKPTSLSTGAGAHTHDPTAHRISAAATHP